jgi:hexosaminidase
MNCSIRPGHVLLLLLTLALTGLNGFSAAVSPLSSHGYTVIPEPQQVKLTGDFQFKEGWRLVLGSNIQPSDVAVESLKEGLDSRYQLKIFSNPRQSTTLKTIHLSLAPKSVEVGQAADRDREALAEQAYKMVLTAGDIDIAANASPGLFYAVQTLLQLIKPRAGTFWLPEGEIVDWPDLQLREIYWDDAHHLDHLDVLKRAVRQSSFFKINGFAIKLEGHFQYKSAPATVEPYALTPAEFQELTDYGLRYFVQVIPFLDGPSHIAFILKHPEYAKFRSFPDSNYELCATNPESYQLLFGMYRDLLDANRGVKYFHLSTDEPYYIGMANNTQCQEEARAKELGSVGKLLAEFLGKAGGYLHDRGRTVIFWGEYPLKPEDIPSLPKYLVNGEVYGPDFDPVFKTNGIRQMVYTSTQGEEPLFPDYYILPASERLHPSRTSAGRVAEMAESISSGPARRQADLMGVFVAAWADAGLHPETFWPGYTTGASYGWRPGSPSFQEAMNSFYALFYGRGVVNPGRIYQLMSRQAQFWEDSWEWTPSSARKPLFGNSDRIFTPRRPERDQTLSLPPVPSPQFLKLSWDWSQEHAKRLQLAAKYLAENDELLDLLYLNLQSVQFNRQNLEAFVAISELCRQNLLLVEGLGRLDRSLKAAQTAATSNQPAPAVAALDEALQIADEIRRQRNQTFQDAVATWYKSWFPRVSEANGRRFLHELDDVKDHVPDRTVDMSYLVYRQLLLPFEQWAEQVVSSRNEYAKSNGLATRNFSLNWKDLSEDKQ